MDKELLEIEFRYPDAPKGKWDSVSQSKTIIIGIFDTFDEAMTAGNKMLELLAKHFEVRGDDKFMKSFLFGQPKRLATNCCYPTKGIQYFARIKKLTFDDLSETIAETFNAYERYKDYKLKENSE